MKFECVNINKYYFKTRDLSLPYLLLWLCKRSEKLNKLKQKTVY